MPHPAGATYEMGDAVVRPTVEEKRKGDWMQTANARKFWPFDPRPQEVFIDDIAAHLAKQCRFNGACKYHYSVAQHSIYVSMIVDPKFALEGLLHDAAEAYCGDMIRPIKMELPQFKNRVELPIERAIFNRYGLAHPVPADVKRADNAVVHAEYLQCMLPGPCQWRLDEPPAPIVIQQWSPEHAEREFMFRFNQLWAERQGDDRRRTLPTDDDVASEEELARFYGVRSKEELIRAQAKHVQRLQIKLRKDNNTAQ